MHNQLISRFSSSYRSFFIRKGNSVTNWLVVLCALTATALISGCGTTTQKLATEQLLISDAVDQAVGEIDFSYLADHDVFLDTSYINGSRGTGFANTDYIISSIRQQLSAAGCRIQEEREDARIIVEPRVGALGTDGHDVTYGIPQAGQLSSAAAALSGTPGMPAIPEISFGRSNQQLGIAKVVLFAYDRDTKVALWQSGVSKSESTSRSTWVLGAGPFQKGTLHDGYRFAGRDLKDGQTHYDEQKILADIDPVPDKLPDPEESPERVAEDKGAAAEGSSKVR